MKIPHPIPYQGSKRHLASQILAHFPQHIDTLIEPFAGSGAITLAAAARGSARRFHLNDLNAPLMELWRSIVEEPLMLARQYEIVWRAQDSDPRNYYDTIRDEFNRSRRPHHFLYLLARCVKAAVRYNAKGEFNQSPDNRRMGAFPETVREQILGASLLLKGKTKLETKDYRAAMAQASTDDLIYLDPPYQGVSRERDRRYLKGVLFENFVETLGILNARNISYIVSYDGRTGVKVHGGPLPRDLWLKHIELDAGRSSQETLLGRAAVTCESLYLSPALSERLRLSVGSPKRQTHQWAFGEATR